MYSSYSAAAFALRAEKPSLHAHSSYSYSYSYLPSHHCHRDDADGHHNYGELFQQSPYLAPRFLLDGCLLRHSAHLLLLSSRLQLPPPPHPRCCRRRAAARCCAGGSGRSVHGHVSWRVEARGYLCCGRGAARSDLGTACRRLEARGCGCGGSGGGRLLGASCGRRDAPRLVGRAVRQEVWEYDGEWPHRRCSMECHDDWEEEEEECGHGQWEVAGAMCLGRRRWEDDDEDRCRNCRWRKGMERYYSGEDAYSGRRRERRDVNEDCGSFRDSDRRRQPQRDYHEDKDDLDLRRRRQRWEGRDSVDTRRVGTRRYGDDGRKYDCRRDRRDFDYDDAVDVRRAGRYAEDDQRFDWITESRDFDVDDEVDVRREGRRRSNDDQRYVTRCQRTSEDTDEEDISLMESRRCRDEEFDYNDQYLTERRYHSGMRSQKYARASASQEDDSKRASSSRNTLDERRARQEDNSSSRVRWHDNVDRRTEQTSEERNRQHSVGWSNDKRDVYDYDDARFVRVRDARTGTHDVKVITEDDTRLASSSKDTSILKHSNNADQQAAVHNNESRKSSQKIMEISEVRGNISKRDSRAQSYHQEDRGNYIENRSSSLQSSVKMASDSRRQVDQRSEVNQHLASLPESRKNSEKFTDVTTDSSRHVSSASHSQRNYDEINQRDIDDRSTSLHNITRVTRDKKRIVNQQVIHETDIDVQKIHAGDISVSRSSQNHSETKGAFGTAPAPAPTTAPRELPLQQLLLEELCQTAKDGAAPLVEQEKRFFYFELEWRSRKKLLPPAPLSFYTLSACSCSTCQTILQIAPALSEELLHQRSKSWSRRSKSRSSTKQALNQI